MFLVSDNEDPVISNCPANQTKDTIPSLSTAVAVWADPQANDNSGITPTVTCSIDSESKFQIGQTEVECKARDPSGNQATCTFIIEVIGKLQYKLFQVSINTWGSNANIIL